MEQAPKPPNGSGWGCLLAGLWFVSCVGGDVIGLVWWLGSMQEWLSEQPWWVWAFYIAGVVVVEPVPLVFAWGIAVNIYEASGKKSRPGPQADKARPDPTSEHHPVQD